MEKKNDMDCFVPRNDGKKERNDGKKEHNGGKEGRIDGKEDCNEGVGERDGGKREALAGMTLGELKAVVGSLSMPPYTAGQIADWLYKKKIRTIDEMTNISAKNRLLLASQFEVGLKPPAGKKESADGTVKYLFAAGGGDDKFVETVFIPAKERSTLCVSSQIGCKMKCAFCMTGRQGFKGNLTSNGILNQILSAPECNELTNVVFMGMGEPLDNYGEVLKTLEILTAPYGFGWSPKRITVSTIGILPSLKRFLDESSCNLAVSLHSPYHDERLSLMPAEKAFPIDAVIDLLHEYDFSHQRRVSFEYIMFEGVNDSEQHAKDLARMLRGIECRVNIIRFHYIKGINLHSCGERKMEFFRDTLNALGITATIRTSRGEDILAACGMLSTGKRQ
jgi:23S rRNA (adenine2503-C2)-methyltransferase